MKTIFNDVAKIRAYHIHLYFEKDTASENTAREVAQAIQERFPEMLESVAKIGKIGPHTAPNYALHLPKEGFAAIVPWLQINSFGLSVLIHPDRDDDLRDHLGPSMWLGTPVPYNEAFFAKLRKETPLHP